VRLRNPGGIANAIATTNQVKGQLGNASVHGNNPAERADAFLTWCDNWATSQLGNHFQPSESVFAEIAESYHRIGALPLGSMPIRQANGMLNREFKDWDARLDRILEDLAAMATFLGHPGHLVVLDTSALMEGVFFADFDWHELDVSLHDQPVRLIVLSLVTEELDELKRRPGERQRAQARRVLTTLWDLHRERPAAPAPLPKLSDVTIEVRLDSGWHHRMPNNDGEIIDQAVGLKELTGQAVILAAGDYTQLYRAAPAGLIAVLMPRPNEV